MRGAARIFIEKEPPRGANLDEYGVGFPEFLARLPPAPSLTYLLEVARLERAVSGALHAPDVEALDPSCLLTVDPGHHGRIVFVPHPSVGLVQADYPVDAIWRAVLAEDEAAMAAIDLSSGPVWLLVQRPETGVDVVRINDKEAICPRSLRRSTVAGSARPGVGVRCARCACRSSRGRPLHRFQVGHCAMSIANSATSLRSSAFAVVGRVVHWLDRVPYTVLAIPLRVAVATVFWDSAMTHLANWQTTLELFETEYALPFLPPGPAAHVAVAIELITPPLLVLGLLTRPAAALLLGMTGVIEVFVYPLAWPTHIQWAAMLLVLLCRGPGNWSVDRVIRRRLFAG